MNGLLPSLKAKFEEKKQEIKNIWIVTREYDGLAGAGGVKDVCRQLAESLVKKADVSVCLPMYGFMSVSSIGFKPVDSFQVNIPYVGVERREDVRIWALSKKYGKHTLTIYLIDAKRYQEKRSVYTYTVEDEADNADHVQGSGHYDYFAMNVLLQKAALGLQMLKDKAELIHVSNYLWGNGQYTPVAVSIAFLCLFCLRSLDPKFLRVRRFVSHDAG